MKRLKKVRKMGKEVNKERLKKGLECCSEPLCMGSKCPYCGAGICRQRMAKDSLEVINKQEEEIKHLRFEVEKAKVVIKVLKETGENHGAKIGGKKNG